MDEFTAPQKKPLIRSTFLLRLAVTVLSCCLFLSGGVSSLHALQGTNPVFERLTIDEGLSHNTVTAILQDNKGYLWFGTLDGLNRYDGYEFTVFRNDPDDPETLSSNFILSLFEDSKGFLWIGTYRGGLCRYESDTGHMTRFSYDAGAPSGIGSDDVGPIVEDRQGRLWLGLREGLDCYDPQTGGFIHYRHDPEHTNSLPGDVVQALLLDTGNTLWIGTTRGLCRLDIDSGAVTPVSLPGIPIDESTGVQNCIIRAIFKDAAGTLWAGSEDGLFRRDAGSDTFTVYHHNPANSRTLGDNIVMSFFEDDNGSFLVGTSYGLDIMDRTTGDFHHYRTDPIDMRSISDNWIKTIFSDRTGILWFGTNNGANKLDPRKTSFNHYMHHPIDTNSLSNNYIKSIAGDRDGYVWIATDSGGLNRFSPADGSFRHYRYNPRKPSAIKSDWTTVIYIDRDDILWVGTGEGLDRFDEKRDGFTHFVHDDQDSSSISHDWIIALAEDGNGFLWVGTGKGLNRFDKKTGKSQRFMYDQSDTKTISNPVIRCIVPDKREIFWVGTDSGLNKLDPLRGTIERIDNTFLSSAKISSIVVTEDAGLWIGTAHGLCFYDTIEGKSTLISANDGLPGNTINALAFDDKERLWITTNNGMAVYDPATGNIKVYDANDGLQSNQFTYGALWKSPDGEIYAGGVNGFNRFHPDSLVFKTVVPKVVITSFMKLHEMVNIRPYLQQNTPMVLDHRENYLTIEFAALDYRSPSRNTYAYKLEGLDKHWLMVGTRRFASYSGIPPGRYVFRVKAANSDGVWNEEGASLAIIITPPFWATLWFRSLCVALFLVSFAATHKLRIRSVERKKNELERVVAERTQELRNRTEELFRERQRLFAILDTLPAFVMLQKADYSVRFANGAFTNKFPKLYAEPCYRVFHGLEEPCAACSTRNCFASNEPSSFEWTPLNGRTYYMSVYPFDDIDGTPLVLKLATDITDRKKAETDKLLTEKLHVVLEMAGAASHEFNQPLQVVSGYMDLMHQGTAVSEEQKKEWLDKIQSQIERMKMISEKLKKITRYKTIHYFQGKKIIDIDGSID